jgi:hypothetical protein
MDNKEPSKLENRGPQIERRVGSGKYCVGCVLGFAADGRRDRLCAFHTGTKQFKSRNFGCGSASRLRWLLRARGVPLIHSELSGGMNYYRLTLNGIGGTLDGCDLIGIWASGSTRTTFLGLIGQDAILQALTRPDADRIVRAIRKEIENAEVEKLSDGYTM